ncbi:RNase adapter RapZ [Ornithinimicrobium sediminis]|uniref:RNase adapter RapZ n=1 Tax=Ornithinimicrobium sediminis TaxID=2904603 RepID=UPI001E439827|nr:RNase adapter RapZ [Ornithinimicrobium sediminis]MCE0487596.1 RNase adapter RapZ [Ornithinimicrobium sediminis]
MTAAAETGPDPRHREFMILTGMSGAGRTTAADVLEDRGWYVVDNIPARMLVELVALTEEDTDTSQRVAAVVDVRSRNFAADFAQAVSNLKAHGWNPLIVFIDATDESLVRRFEAVRRPHPLQGDGLLLDGIRQERRLLADFRSGADVVIDTTNYNVHQLSAKVDELFSNEVETRLRLAVLSFGFKYGIPLDADIVLDLRFLPNPYWDPELRSFTGRDAPVRDYVLGRPGAQEYIGHAEALVRTSVTGYLAEGRRHVTVAVGCTGGKHRSVATVEELVRRLGDMGGVQITSFHRDLGRE